MSKNENVNKIQNDCRYFSRLTKLPTEASKKADFLPEHFTGLKWVVQESNS